ncbi:hypothetical protein JCM11641_007353 [Rhodosporidiobolus odoratus]
MSTTPFLVHGIASTILLSLAAVPLLYCKSLLRAGLHLAFLPTSSTLFAASSGLLSLVALGTGSRGASVVSGVAGALAVGLLDVHVLIWAWRREQDEVVERRRRVVKLVLAGLLSALLVTATALHVALLCLFDPSTKSLSAFAAARAVVHLLFTVLTMAARIILLQGVAIVLDILSVALPLHQNYAAFASDTGRRASPTLYGTSLSPAGQLLVVLFVAIRWTGFVVVAAGAATTLSAPSRTSLAVHYQRSVTPSPSTAPLTADRAASPFASTVHRPSTSMSRVLDENAAFPRSPTPWSTAARHATTVEGAASAENEGGSPDATLGSTEGKKRDRHRSISSLLSSKFALGRSRASAVNQPSSGGGVEVQTIELQHPYFHTETVPVKYADSSNSGQGSGTAEGVSGTEEDLVVEGPIETPTPSPRAKRTSSLSHRSLPPLVMTTAHHTEPATPPTSPRASSSANASPVRIKRSSSSRSFSPLLFRKHSINNSPTTAPRDFTPSPYPVETPPSSPERTRTSRPGTGSSSTSAPPTPSRTQSGTLRRGHTSSASATTAYYSLPRSPTTAGQGSPKKSRRPSLGTLPSLAGSAISGIGVEASPTKSRSRSGSVGSLLRSLNNKRESATPSLAASVGGQWAIEPNEEGDDPFAPAPLGEEGKKQEERVKEWERRKSQQSLVGGGKLEGGVGTVTERSEENEDEEEGERGSGSSETGSVVDYGEEAELGEREGGEEEDVERVLTPLPTTGDASDDGEGCSRSRRDSSPATARPRRHSDSSNSIFTEHFDDEPLPSPPPQHFSPVPATALSHSASAGALGSAFRSSGEVDRPVASPPALSHAHSFASLPATPPKHPRQDIWSCSPYAAAGRRFSRGLSDASETGQETPKPFQLHVSSPISAPHFAYPASTSSTSRHSSPRPPSPLVIFKRATGGSGSFAPARSPIRPHGTPSSSAALAGPTGGSSLFTSASFTLRKMRLRGSSLPNTGPRDSSGSDLSFACRGPVWTPSEHSGPLSAARDIMPSLATRLGGNEEEQVEKVETSEPKVRPAPPQKQAKEQPQLLVTTARGGGRKTWWKGSLPGSRPSTYHRSTTSSPRLARSTSSGASFPSFLRPSTSGSGSGESSSSSKLRRTSLRFSARHPSLIPRLSAFQLDEPAQVSPFGSLGSFVFPEDRSSGSEPFTSVDAALSRSHPLAPRKLSPVPPSLLRREGSAATYKGSYFSARTGFSTSADAGRPSSGRIEEEHLNELDDLIRTFSPGALEVRDPEWPSYPSTENGETSFEFSERGFEGEGQEGYESSEEGQVRLEGRWVGSTPFHNDGGEYRTLKHRRHASAPAISSPTSTSRPSADEGERSFGSSSVEAETSPLSPAFSFAPYGRMFEREQGDNLASPITPASFSFGGGRIGEKAQASEIGVEDIA